MIDHYCRNRVHSEKCLRVLVEKIYHINASRIIDPNDVIKSEGNTEFNQAS